MGKKITKELFIYRAKEIHGDKYDYSLVEYLNNRTHVNIICNEHDEPFMFKQTPYSHSQKGNGCPLCSNKYSYDYNEYLKRAKNAHNNKYKYPNIKNEYVNTKTKITIICPEHGEFIQEANAHLSRKSSCPKCIRRNLSTVENYIKEANIIHDNKYDYSLVKELTKNINIICPKHGKFLQNKSNHINGSGCRMCAKCEPHTQETLIDKFNESHGDKYDYSLVRYNGNIRDKVKIICQKHGIFKQEAYMHYYSKQGCPKCKTSKGELKILEYLESNNIDYTYQHKFDDLKKYSYDFFIPSKNITIEYDGKQHFEVNEFFGGKTEFQKIQKRDKIKNNYCKEKGIQLIRIPYTDFDNIEDILNLKL